jgi:PAS domain S-box-containing protein
MSRTDKTAAEGWSTRGSRSSRVAAGAREVRALKSRVGELEELFDEASVGLVWTTRAGRVLRANRAVLEILECRREDCVGHAWAGFHSDRAALDALIGQLARRETLRNHSTALRARGGRLKEVLVDASAFWEQGKVVHLRWFIRDITRRKQLEREVLATTERERRRFAREWFTVGRRRSAVRPG